MKIAPIVRGILASCAIFLALAYTLRLGPFWAPAVVTGRACPGPSTPPYGFPAIHPHDNCTPSFTIQDVRTYVQTSGNFGLGHMGPAKNITVTQVIFTTSRDASRLMDGETTGLPDDAIVCYAELRGTASGQATFLPVGVPAKESTQQVTIKVIFDAHTGNELEFSIQ